VRARDCGEVVMKIAKSDATGETSNERVPEPSGAAIRELPKFPFHHFSGKSCKDLLSCRAFIAAHQVAAFHRHAYPESPRNRRLAFACGGPR